MKIIACKCLLGIGICCIIASIIIDPEVTVGTLTTLTTTINKIKK